MTRMSIVLTCLQSDTVVEITAGIAVEVVRISRHVWTVSVDQIMSVFIAQTSVVCPANV